jgi:hypothetical protein
MKENDTKQFKIKKKDWIKLEEIRLELSKRKKSIITKMDTLTVVLDEQLKKYSNE